jgi:hypothetical protein
MNTEQNVKVEHLLSYNKMVFLKFTNFAAVGGSRKHIFGILRYCDRIGVDGAIDEILSLTKAQFIKHCTKLDGFDATNVRNSPHMVGKRVEIEFELLGDWYRLCCTMSEYNRMYKRSYQIRKVLADIITQCNATGDGELLQPVNYPHWPLPLNCHVCANHHNHPVAILTDYGDGIFSDTDFTEDTAEIFDLVEKPLLYSNRYISYPLNISLKISVLHPKFYLKMCSNPIGNRLLSLVSHFVKVLKRVC